MTGEMTLDEAKTALNRAEEGLLELINLKANQKDGLGIVNSSIAGREETVLQLRQLVRQLREQS